MPKTPTRILPCELPTPSAYSGKEGACAHEWKYLNFNADGIDDKQRFEKLHHTICSGEMEALTSYGKGAAEDVSASYKRFFPQNGEDEDDNYDSLRDHVIKVLGVMGTAPTERLD